MMKKITALAVAAIALLIVTSQTTLKNRTVLGRFFLWAHKPATNQIYTFP